MTIYVLNGSQNNKILVGLNMCIKHTETPCRQNKITPNYHPQLHHLFYISQTNQHRHYSPKIIIPSQSQENIH